MIEDREYIVEQLNRVERNLRRAADATARASSEFAEKGLTDVVTSLLNELLWALPNLGIQGVISSTMREAEREKKS